MIITCAYYSFHRRVQRFRHRLSCWLNSSWPILHSPWTTHGCAYQWNWNQTFRIDSWWHGFDTTRSLEAKVANNHVDYALFLFIVTCTSQPIQTKAIGNTTIDQERIWKPGSLFLARFIIALFSPSNWLKQTWKTSTWPRSPCQTTLSQKQPFHTK